MIHPITIAEPTMREERMVVTVPEVSPPSEEMELEEMEESGGEEEMVRAAGMVG